KAENAPLVTPVNYFETLEHQITSRIAIEQFTDKTQQGFTIPNGYFEKLQQNIITKTAGAKTVKLWQQTLFKYAAAASILLFLTTGWLVNRQYKTKQANKLELAKDQLLYDIDENVIFEYIEENQSTKNNAPSTNEMEDYILNNLSTSDLSNNL